MADSARQSRLAHMVYFSLKDKVAGQRRAAIGRLPEVLDRPSRHGAVRLGHADPGPDARGK